MASIYVANGTYQMQHFLYRVPEAKEFRRLEIPPGRQMKFREDFSEHEVRFVVEQLERFGARPVNDLRIMHPRVLIYKVDRPIASEKIDEAREQDLVVRQQVAADMMDATAQAQFSETSQQLGEMGFNPNTVESTTLEIVQLDDSGREERHGENDVDAETTVSRRAGRRENSKRRG